MRVKPSRLLITPRFFLFFPGLRFALSSSPPSSSSIPCPLWAPTVGADGSTSRNKCKRAASFSPERTVMNPQRSSALTETSLSNLMTSGSPMMPHLVNSTKTLGMVAENSNVCLPLSGPGILEQICRICMANPISNSRSASSKTTTSHCLRWKSGISDK